MYLSAITLCGVSCLDLQHLGLSVPQQNKEQHWLITQTHWLVGVIAKNLLVDVSEEFDVVEKGDKVEDGHWEEQDQSGGEGRLQQTNNYEKNKQTITRTNKQTNNYLNI